MLALKKGLHHLFLGEDQVASKNRPPITLPRERVRFLKLKTIFLETYQQSIVV